MFKGIILRRWVHSGNKHQAAFVASLFFAVFYLIPNHVHWVEPKLLPMTFIDTAMPFVPVTYWIYSSTYVFLFAPIFFLKDLDRLNRLFYAFGAMTIFASVFFVFWPTTYPREAFPIPPDTDPITLWAFEMFRAVDTPANCAPSLHVSNALMTGFAFLGTGRFKSIAANVLAVAIAISTLTTKQHYFFDVVTGTLLAASTWWVFFQKAEFEPVAQANAKPQSIFLH